MARGLSRGTPMGTPVGTPLPPIAEVELGLGRIGALHHRPSTPYQMREDKRYLCLKRQCDWTLGRAARRPARDDVRPHEGPLSLCAAIYWPYKDDP
jgi:hypothetical protein